jgi:hypothetical protein
MTKKIKSLIRKVIDDYLPTAGKVKQILSKVNGNQPGDPVEGSEAIIHITEVKILY